MDLAPVGRDPKLDDELNRRALTDTLPRFAERPGPSTTSAPSVSPPFLKARDLISDIPLVETYAIEPK